MTEKLKLSSTDDTKKKAPMLGNIPKTPSGEVSPITSKMWKKFSHLREQIRSKIYILFTESFKSFANPRRITRRSGSATEGSARLD